MKIKRFDLSKLPPWMTLRSTAKKAVDYLKATDRVTPYLLIDRDRLERKAKLIGLNIPGSTVYYAVKANPHPEILRVVQDGGLGFEIASEGELRVLVQMGVPPEKMISSNPMKTPLFLREAYEAGVRYFALDSLPEVRKTAELAPGSSVYVRLSVPNEGSEWPLSRKFGVEIEEALLVLKEAGEKGLVPAGLTFHVGSQCTNPYTWETALDKAARLWELAAESGIRMNLLNIGGGYPIQYTRNVVEVESVERRVQERILALFPPEVRVMIEPGRAVVGDAGVFVTSVTGKAKRVDANWLYLDVGVFNGLMEAVGGIRYTYVTENVAPLRKWTIAGPSCDSFDVVGTDIELPEPEVGDRLLVLGAGAYTTSYASEFNGFSIPDTILI